jgi:hypothetical protein
VLDHDALELSDVRSKEAALESQVLVSGGHIEDTDKRQIALIVFKHGGADQTGG